ncbi:MAG: hypothetical protein WBA17_07815, partial [Saprospiraceae bacterium]
MINTYRSFFNRIPAGFGHALLVAFFSFPLLLTAQGVGFFETYVVVDNGSGNTFYDAGATTGNSDFQNTDLGTFACGDALLVGAQGKTFKCPPCDITGTRLFYRVYSGAPAGAFVPLNLPFASNDGPALCSGGQNQTWQEVAAGRIDVLDGLVGGTYTLEVYFEGSSSGDDPANNVDCAGGTFFDSNNSANYQATFTIAGDIVNTSTTESFCTIQDAIDAPNTVAGNVINVAAGTYTGDVVINKGITLNGANAGVSACGARAAEAIMMDARFTIAADGVTIDGFEFTGANAQIRSSVGATTNDDIAILNNYLHATTAQIPIQHGLGAGGGVASTNWVVDNNKIEDIQAANATAIALFNITNVQVTNNCIDHTNAAFSGRRGINADGLQDATIQMNDIDLGDAAANGVASPWGIQISMSDRDAVNITVADNIIENTGFAVLTLSQRNVTGLTVTGNELLNVNLGVTLNTGGTAPQISSPLQSDITIANNTITSNNRSIFLRSLHDTDPNGPVRFENVTINENSLIRNGTGAALEAEVGLTILDGPIDGTMNWFGTTDPQEVDDRVEGDIDFSNFLVSGTDSEPGTRGFQPNNTPMAVCQPVVVNADANCMDVTTVAADFDGGSTDDDGDVLMFTTNVSQPFALGVTNITLTVSDGVLSVMCMTTITVNDVTPPVIECEDITVELDANGMATIENTTAVTAGPTDNCDTNPSGPFTMGGPSMRMFDCDDIGEIIMRRVVSSDDDNNQGFCDYMVTVVDNIAPTITCAEFTNTLEGCPEFLGPNTPNGVWSTLPASGMLNTAVGGSFITTIDLSTCVADNCSDLDEIEFTLGRSFEENRTGGSVDLINVIIFRDASLNESMDSVFVRVTIQDTEAPVVTCPEFTNTFEGCPGPLGPNTPNGVWSTLPASGMLNSTVGGSFTTTIDLSTCVTDNCSDLDEIEFTLGRSFEENRMGGSVDLVNVIIFRDAALNESPDSVFLRVTIQDTEAPFIVCRDTTVALDADGMAMLENGDVVTSIIDNCDPDPSGPNTMGGPGARTFDCTQAGTDVSVTVVSSDDAGNEGSCTYTVSVVDTLAPVLVCRDTTVALNAAGTAMLD